ncbi:hypothetical protein QYH69_07815 [Paraburkholderia sp. SARCC-3016]|uniref:hypothetical protein n=1 Tax=Paraburkholderia sp. SARCC-3016 TaxID=3058611 RepID=UPI002806D60E|nr:hypothetical protein [Paraburkholderia sp. SARCC-3016]MDQ7977152.1 hypothetical protein [Paraburkholderia sp. SARCC-3016]
MNRVHCIAALAAGAALSLSSGAHAESFFEVEAGLGVTHFDIPDGRWNQQGSPQSALHVDFPAFKIGTNFRVYEGEKFGVRAHVDYVNLGHLSARCECTEDRNYDLATKKVLDPSIPTANLSGSGNAQGVALTLEPYFLYRGWHIGVEAGLFPYRPSYSVSAFWHLDGSTHTYDTPHTLQWGQVVGLNVQRGNFGISYQYYRLPTRYDDEHNPAMYKGAHVLMLTVNTNGLF